VFLTSRCKVDYRCHVTTNTNPKGVKTVVPAGKTVRVRTHLSSPSPDFQVKVDCKQI
jgi:hypothetical protein